MMALRYKICDGKPVLDVNGPWIMWADHRDEMLRMQKAAEDDLRDAARGAAEEATWKATQGEDYGCF